MGMSQHKPRTGCQGPRPVNLEYRFFSVLSVAQWCILRARTTELSP